MATVELDGSPFKLDSSSSGNNVGSGVVWGVGESHVLSSISYTFADCGTVSLES